MMTPKTLINFALAALAFIGQTAVAAEPAAPEEPTLKRQQQLRQLLVQDCSVCHGKLLYGNIAPPLTPRALAGKTERQLVKTIIHGHSDREMPGWGWKLQEYEARWMIRFLRSSRIDGQTGETGNSLPE